MEHIWSVSQYNLLNMSSSSSNHANRQRLVENITLLWTLNEIPEQPRENVPCHENDGSRQLTPERERQVADSFAFISASTDNMRRVMAVAVEEEADGKGMTIRFASNTGDSSSLKESLGDIATTLEKAARRSTNRVPQIPAFADTNRSWFTVYDQAWAIRTNRQNG